MFLWFSPIRSGSTFARDGKFLQDPIRRRLYLLVPGSVLQVGKDALPHFALRDEASGNPHRPVLFERRRNFAKRTRSLEGGSDS